MRQLRSTFCAVVPQQPVLFGGSLRENLDPYGRASDEQLAATLQVGVGCADIRTVLRLLLRLLGCVCVCLGGEERV